MSKPRTVRVKNTSRISSGHLWLFRTELQGHLEGLNPGELVYLTTTRGDFLGTGYINPSNTLAVRLLSHRKITSFRDFFIQSLERAINYRKTLYGKLDTCRLVFSEGDLLPGLIVDKYEGVLVVQILTAGMQRHKKTIINGLKELLEPECIVLRNDSPFRLTEGLPQEKAVVHGKLPESLLIKEGNLTVEVDPLEGQKTGMFLDQRENRIAFSELVPSNTVGLDLFCYNGLWGLHLAKKGCQVTLVDSSSVALRMAKRNAALNGLQGVEFIECDAFEFLTKEKARRPRTYDFVVLDPPAFVKSKRTLPSAIKGYKSINANAMALLKPGGFMATSSCSQHLSDEAFLEVIRYAARVNNLKVRLIEMRSQAKDHPWLVSMPETKYLKCAFLQVL